MEDGASDGGSVWRPYGLRSNPFFTGPLDAEPGVKRGIQLFRGIAREADAQRIAHRILNDDNSVTLVEGPSGIGKTTLANRVKHLLAGDPRTAVYPGSIQIDIRSDPLPSFIAELMHAALVALRRNDTARHVTGEATAAAEGLILDHLVQATSRQWGLHKVLGVTWTRSFLLGEAARRPAGEWVDALRNLQAIAASAGIERIVVHVNNLDQSTLTDPPAVGHFFGQIRDILQADGFHFILCANEAFRFRALDDRPNVTDIIGSPVLPAALSAKEIETIVQARYEDAADGGPVVPPIPPDEAARLFEYFEGELRAAFEVLGQTFMQELGPTGRTVQLRAEEVIRIQTPLISRMLDTLPDTQVLVLAAVAECTRKRSDVRQKELVAFIQAEVDDPPSQPTISKAAIALAKAHWLVRRQQNLRSTYYALGGRAKIVRPLLLARLASSRPAVERRLSDFG